MTNLLQGFQEIYGARVLPKKEQEKMLEELETYILYNPSTLC